MTTDDLLERSQSIPQNPPGSHAGAVLVRLSDHQPAGVLTVLRRLIASEDPSQLAGKPAVGTEDRTRMRIR